MAFKENRYYKNNYDYTSQESIHGFAKRLINSSLKQICHEDILLEDINYSQNKNIKKRSGRGIGSYLEEFYFGYSRNSKPEPDFPEAELELKSAGLKYHNDKYIKKEPRLTLGTIQNNEIVDEEFETSSFYKKNKALLILFWLEEKNNSNIHPIDKRFLFTTIYRLDGKDYEVIKKDWEYIRNKIRDCEAHNLRNRETVNLESCGGEGKENYYYNCPIPAKKKRFAYTKKFWNSIIDEACNS